MSDDERVMRRVRLEVQHRLRRIHDRAEHEEREAAEFTVRAADLERDGLHDAARVLWQDAAAKLRYARALRFDARRERWA